MKNHYISSKMKKNDGKTCRSGGGALGLAVLSFST